MSDATHAPILIDRAAERRSLVRSISALMSYRELIRNLVYKDLTLKYRGSVLGFLWSLVNPLATVAVYTLAFKYILNVQQPGFPVFVLLGILAWSFFANSAVMATGALIEGANLLKAVRFPRLVLPLATVLFNLVQYVLTIVVLLPLMFLAYRMPPAGPLLVLPVFLFLQVLLTAGLATMLAAAATFFRDVRHFVDIGLSLLFWTTPIVYPLTQVPKSMRTALMFSPMTPFVVAYQRIFYYGDWPGLEVWIVAIVYGLGAFVAGTLWFLSVEERLGQVRLMSVVIDAQRVSKRFYLRHNRSHELKVRFLAMFHERHREVVEEFWALRDVSLTIRSGEAVGVIGRNGSGKSTLLKIVAGLHLPTTGRLLAAPMRIGALIELGVGFHPELSGEENVYLNTSIYGMKRTEIAELYPQIVEYAGLQHFMDTPLKSYSSGMKLRLGFAIAANLDPDILLLDEIFAVGDAEFERQCLKTLERFRAQDKTILFVSHQPRAVRSMCDRVCVLDHGRLQFVGPVDEGLEFYERLTQTAPDGRSADRGTPST